MKNFTCLKCVFALLFASFSSSLFAQMYPLSFDERVENSPVIALVRVKDKQGYWDAARTNIWTRNELEVIAYFKGASSATTLVALSPGGVVGTKMEYVCPAETYEINKEYLVFLKGDNIIVDDKQYRSANPAVRQCISYAGMQSVLQYVNGKYHDVLTEAPFTEEQLVQRMSNSYGLQARRPSGVSFAARAFIEPPSIELVTGITDGTGSLPATGFVNGTIPANNELIINGNGFGATTGSIDFPNINTGGITSTVASVDIISWSNTQIRTKIPDLAGTGTLTVRDNTAVNVGTSAITIKWGEINFTNAFLNHATAERNQVRLLDMNGMGGYTFEFSSSTASGPSFFANTVAKQAFARALRTWRCNTLVNYNINSAAGNPAGFAADLINIVMYDDVTLPAGALGVCTSRFNASGTGGQCDLFNTVYYLEEMDIRVLTIPVPTTTWNYTTNPPTGTEYDFESVMAHEIGHGHGLTHINLGSTLMFRSIANGQSKRTPSANEIEAGQYRITVSNTNCLDDNGFSGFDPHVAISPAVCNLLLPLTLVDFSGEKRFNVIDLEWITESEQNTRGFYVERSVNGQPYTSIGFVAAKGTPGRNTYKFTDNNRFVSGVVHYRLRMEDVDANFKYSKIIQFSTDPGVWKLFPNPAKESIKIVSDKLYTGKTLVQITDLAGRVVLTQTLDQLNPGAAVPVSINKLPSGLYTISVSSGNEIIFREKFTVQ